MVSELPFFTLFLLSISIQTLRLFLRYMIWGQTDKAWEFLSGNLPRAIAVTYLITLLVYYSRSKVVKISNYVLASILLVVCVFLLRVFGKTLQPDIIILLAETNAKESSEFLSSFLFTPGGITALLSLITYVTAIVFLEKRRVWIAMWWRQHTWQRAMNGVLCVLVCVGLVQFKTYIGALDVKNADNMNKLGG